MLHIVQEVGNMEGEAAQERKEDSQEDSRHSKSLLHVREFHELV